MVSLKHINICLLYFINRIFYYYIFYFNFNQPYVLDIKNSKFLVLFKVSSFIYKRIYDYDGKKKKLFY